jgi:hypothetical protein
MAALSNHQYVKTKVRSGSGSSVGVAGGDAAFPEFGQHGGVVDVEVFADSCE